MHRAFPCSLTHSSSLLGKGGLEGLEDLELDAGLGLLGLGRGRSEDLVSLGEAGADVLASVDYSWVSFKRAETHLDGEVLEGVRLDGVDGQRVVAVHGGEAGRD